MKRRIAIAGLLSILVGVAGTGASATQLLPLFDLLVTTAGISFGVSGAWIAIVHRAEMAAASPKSGRFKNLIRSMLASAATIGVVLIVRGAHVVVASQSWVPPAALPWLRGATLSVWSFLALVQLWALYAMLPSARYAQAEIDVRAQRERLLGSLPPKRGGATPAAAPPATAAPPRPTGRP